MKKTKMLCSVLLLSLFALVATQNETYSDLRPDYGLPWNEMWALRNILSGHGMPVRTMSAHYANGIRKDVSEKFETVGAEYRFDQYFVYADINPDCQSALVGFYSPGYKLVVFLGADRISTGNPHRPGHFATPIGIFANTTGIIGYRALGTRNDDGQMGLGIAGSKVWDFGWIPSFTSRNGKPEIHLIRFQIHSTDPVFGEALLGQAESKGCVRVSNAFNWILDHHSLLDRDYVQAADKKRFFWLLLPDREPLANAGRYLITGDSKKFK